MNPDGDPTRRGTLVWRPAPRLRPDRRVRLIRLHSVLLAELPDIDLVRPAACPHCDQPARAGGRLHLYGHGPRTRSVVIPGPELGRCRLVTCWVRRFLCQACEKTFSVLPDGVLLGFTYSVASMIAAWLGITSRPVGEGLSHEEVYALQGVDRLRREAHRSGRKRWRALKRWADRHLADRPGTTWKQRVQAFLIDHALRGAAM